MNSVPLGCESWLNLTPGQVTTWTCLCPFNGCLGCLALLCQPTGTCFGQFKVYPKHCYHVLPIWAVSISKLFHVNHLFKLKQVVCVCLCVCVCVCVSVCVCVCLCVCVYTYSLPSELWPVGAWWGSFKWTVMFWKCMVLINLQQVWIPWFENV